MPDRWRLERAVRSTLREAGERYESLRRSTDDQLAAAREAYEAGKHASTMPRDEQDRACIVCRRYVERRAVEVDEAHRPACYEADHPDCAGCLEDIHAGRIETWSPESVSPDSHWP